MCFQWRVNVWSLTTHRSSKFFSEAATEDAADKVGDDSEAALSCALPP